ncbi:MAG: response regulator [Firmicutes bacterium]|nr:response regulator [Bacillota bacterium]
MKHIVVVDDNFGVRLLLEQAIKELGFNVKTYSSGNEALLRIIFTPPDLVIMDIKMPGIGGFEALKLIARYCYNVPVIMMSAYSETEEVKEARREGVL